MNIQCPNPACKADNPGCAKFCRKCGTALMPADGKNKIWFSISNFFKKIFRKKRPVITEAFTLDTFKYIPLQPVSVVKVRFMNRFVVAMFLTFLLLFVVTATEIDDELLVIVSSWLYYEVYTFHEETINMICLSIACLCVLPISVWLFKKLRYRLNADYIENSFVNNNIVRIARRSRMGLFDKSKNKVLLPSKYSGIDRFEGQLLLINKDGKYGLYSLAYRRIIVPVKYDTISQFVNSVTSATVEGVTHHYDIKGNKLR